MRVPTLTPHQLRGLAADGVDAAHRAMSTAPRFIALLDTAEELLERVTKLVSRIEHIERDVAGVVERVGATQASARSVVDQAAATADRLADLIDRYEPSLHSMSPAVVRLSESFGGAEVDDLVSVVRRAPRLTQQLADDVVPVIETLRTIAPDLTDLLAASHTLNEIIGSVPGLSRAKKRADEQVQSSD